MKIIHIAITPLAGSPIRIVNGLRTHTDIDARLITLNVNAYNTRIFENDIDWGKNKDLALDELKKADIIHFHHYFDLKNNLFNLDFTRINKNTKFIRQFHSTPMTIADGDKVIANEIVNSDIPQLVIAQHQERYFYKARVVPNIVPISDKYYRYLSNSTGKVRIFYSPSVINSGFFWGERKTLWDTKGYYETVSLLKKIKRKTGVEVCVVTDMPHDECLKAKQMSDIFIDEMITGSYHLSSLEALSQGVPTFSYLDPRIESLIKDMTGSDRLPWSNFKLEEAYGGIIELIENHELRAETSHFSRKWMEKYYNDKVLINHYLEAYDSLVNTNEVSKKENKVRMSVDWPSKESLEEAWDKRRRNYIRLNFINYFYIATLVKYKNKMKSISRFCFLLIQSCIKYIRKKIIGFDKQKIHELDQYTIELEQRIVVLEKILKRNDETCD